MTSAGRDDHRGGFQTRPCRRYRTRGDFLVVIRINGKDSEVAPDISVAQLLEDLELRPGRVVVELNAEVLSRMHTAART